VLSENTWGVSTPFRYAFTSGIPEPAAEGAMYTQSIAANMTNSIFAPAYTRNANTNLHFFANPKCSSYLNNHKEQRQCRKRLKKI
jgi:hypothetical protein